MLRCTEKTHNAKSTRKRTCTLPARQSARDTTREVKCLHGTTREGPRRGKGKTKPKWASTAWTNFCNKTAQFFWRQWRGPNFCNRTAQILGRQRQRPNFTINTDAVVSRSRRQIFFCIGKNSASLPEQTVLSSLQRTDRHHQTPLYRKIQPNVWA